MNLKEYYKVSERTFKPLGQKLDFLHCTMGLVTEFGEFVDPLKRHIFYGKELDVVNLKEELGDMMWYLAIPIRYFGLEEREMIDQKIIIRDYEYNHINNIINISDIIFSLNNDINIVVDQLNCISPDANTIFYEISLLISNIYSICNYFKIDFEDMLETNINKLKARFPEKFTEYHALNRDLVKERNILEGVIDNE